MKTAILLLLLLSCNSFYENYQGKYKVEKTDVQDEKEETDQKRIYPIIKVKRKDMDTREHYKSCKTYKKEKGEVYVKEHYKKDGTYVKAHTRSSRGSLKDKWGNIKKR